MKKVLLLLMGVVVALAIGVAVVFLNFAGGMDIYKYIPKDAKCVLSVNLNAPKAKDILEYKGKEWQLKTVKRFLIIPNKNIDMNSRDVAEVLDVMLIQSSLKETAINMLSKYAKNKNIEDKILPDGFHEMTFKNIKNMENIVLYAKIEGGNAIVAKTKERVNEVIKNASEKNAEPFKKGLEKNENKIISVVLQMSDIELPGMAKNMNNFESLVGSLDYEKGFYNFNGEVNFKKDENVEFKKIFGDKKDNKGGKVFIKKNKIYLKIQPEYSVFLKMILPNIAINESGEKNGEEIELKANQFLYSYIVPRDGVVEKINGYLNSDSIVIQFSIDEKGALILKNAKESEKLLKETQAALGF